MPIGDMVLDGPEAFGADHMFNAARILHGCLLVHAKVHEPLGKHGVAFIHGLGDFFSNAAEGDMALVIHEDITVDVYKRQSSDWAGKRETAGIHPSYQNGIFWVLAW